jgi:hypothetical protein
MTRGDLERFKRASVEADYKKGIPFYSPLAAGTEARICCLDGMTFEDIMKPGFAAIVISADR